MEVVESQWQSCDIDSYDDKGNALNNQKEPFGEGPLFLHQLIQPHLLGLIEKEDGCCAEKAILKADGGDGVRGKKKNTNRGPRESVKRADGTLEKLEEKSDQRHQVGPRDGRCRT